MRAVALTIGMALTGLVLKAQTFEAGEKVFKMNCASCHKMDAKLIGPPLMNVVADQGEDWTRRWILNNDELRKSGDAHAIAIFEEYNKQVMPNYSYLSDDELTGLIAYLKDWKEVEVAKTVAASAAPAPSAAGQPAAAMVAPSAEWTSTAKLAAGIAAVALLLTVVTMYTLLQAFKAIVQYRLHDASEKAQEHPEQHG